MRFNRYLISFRLILDQLSTTTRENLWTNEEKTEPIKKKCYAVSFYIWYTMKHKSHDSQPQHLCYVPLKKF